MAKSSSQSSLWSWVMLAALSLGAGILIGLGFGQMGKSYSGPLRENFSKPIEVRDGKAFGMNHFLTFELFRNGTFVIDDQSGVAWQQSPSYRDSAIIRSTKPLPPTYIITVVVGEIHYDLAKVQRYAKDPEYAEGPRGENGVYLLSITDAAPSEHYTNDWWHQHRKLVIDVDNNEGGAGMPNPIFMVYFDQNNDLRAWSERSGRWGPDWDRALQYHPNQWYRIELEKTEQEYIFRIMTENGKILRESSVPISRVWHSEETYPEYFVMGDPHENYYEGAVKIKSITIRHQNEF